MNVVIIPCFNRPEFLYITLENVKRASNSDKFVYLFSLDSGYDPEIENIINEFPYDKIVIKRKKTQYKAGKQSYNLLEAYREAAYLSDEYVILLEDDFFINADFFDWHLAVMNENKNAFCSIGTANHNTWHETLDDDSAYYFGTDTDYQSWGVCWRKEVLERLIIPHCKDIYYSNPQSYVKNVFKGNWLAHHFCEQDGLIRRIRNENKDMEVIFAHKPRAFHAGFYSYHRESYRPSGTIMDKVEYVLSIINDKDKYAAACGEFKDSEQIDLQYKFSYNKPIYKPVIKL